MSSVPSVLKSQTLDALRGSDAGPRSGPALARLATLAALAATIYGAAMGSYGVFYGGSAWQVLFAAVKSPLLLGVTFALTLPSFLVINVLMGLRDDLADVLHALLSAQVCVAIALVSLAPVTLLWYASVSRYESAILFNAAVFAAASFGAQVPLRARYAALVRRNRLHGRLLRAWLGVYAFVGVQTGWVLRPFVGDPAKTAEFLRPEKWDNAYVIVVRIAWRALFH